MQKDNLNVESKTIWPDWGIQVLCKDKTFSGINHIILVFWGALGEQYPLSKKNFQSHTEISANILKCNFPLYSTEFSA